MKILFATMQYARGYSQGAERYVETLARGLLQHGCVVTVLGGDPESREAPAALGQPLGVEQPAGVPVLHYPTRTRLAIHGTPPDAFDALLDRLRPDVVHIVSPAHIGVGLLEAAARRGIPTVVTVVDYWWICPKHTLEHYQSRTCDGRVSWNECVRCMGGSDRRAWVRRLADAPVVGDLALPLLFGGRAVLDGLPPRDLRDWPRRRPVLHAVLAGASRVILLSRAAQTLLGDALDPAKTAFIPVGLEGRWFDEARTAPPNPAPRDPADLTIGYVGALVEHKGVHTLLDAVRRLGWTKTRIRLAGDGPPEYLASLRALAAGLNAEFVGRIDSQAVPAFHRTLDLIVLPSAWTENMPQAVMEALALRTPLIASDAPGIAEIIADQAALFQRGSAAALAERLAAWAAAPFMVHDAIRPTHVDEMVRATLALYRDVYG